MKEHRHARIRRIQSIIHFTLQALTLAAAVATLSEIERIHKLHHKDKEHKHLL